MDHMNKSMSHHILLDQKHDLHADLSVLIHGLILVFVKFIGNFVWLLYALAFQPVRITNQHDEPKRTQLASA